MKTFPKVSVLMPNYNAWKYISEAIQGILNQTFTDFEFIIIDDCSTDNSWEIIQEFAKKDERIVALRNDENLKICKTLNKGLELAKWEYIARMDSDDIAMDIWLENVYQKISQNEKIGVCGSNFWIIDSNGKILKEKTFPETEKEAKNAIWLRNPLLIIPLFFEKVVMKNLVDMMIIFCTQKIWSFGFVMAKNMNFTIFKKIWWNTEYLEKILF